MPTLNFSCALAAVLAAGLSLPFAASAQNDADPATRHAPAHKPPPQSNKVLGGIQRGTDTAGRSIEHADASARRGVNSASERACRRGPTLGEPWGGRRPGAWGGGAHPAGGPRGGAP